MPREGQEVSDLFKTTIYNIWQKKDNWIALYIEKFRGEATGQNYSLSRFRQEAPGENSHAGILKKQR